MKACEQATGYSVHQHGLDVANRYRDLYDLLHGKKPCYSWSLKREDDLKRIALRALTPTEARLYHVFHDCGKPDVLMIENGRRHFPGHVDASVSAFKAVVGEFHQDYDVTLQLMSLDMGFHTFRGDQLHGLCQHSLAPTLYLTAWAELHANAEVLFGGFESDSFKIKRKALEKAASKIS